MYNRGEIKFSWLQEKNAEQTEQCPVYEREIDKREKRKKKKEKTRAEKYGSMSMIQN